MKKNNTTYLITLCALVFASCSESDGLFNGIALSKEKIAFAATLQDGWNGGKSAEAGNSSRAGKPSFSGLAMEQKVLTANEGLAKPLYLHPLETENTSVMNAMPQTRGAMNESSTVGSFGVSAVYSKDGVNYSPLFQNEEATQNGNYWFTSSKKTWPLDGSVSFYAYAPYNETSLSLQGSNDVVKNKTIRYTANTDFSKQPDLIVAKSENNAFTSSTVNKAVGLSFSHALTAITFSISADMIPGTVKSITVSGVYGQGDYDFSNASWPSASLANPSTYVITLNASVKAGESKALTDKTSALMMIPQNLSAGAVVSMVFNDGAKDKTVSFSLNGTSWTAGKHITYVLSSSKITTLNMGSLTYPTGWNSVNTGATDTIRTAYASNTSAGLYVVNEDRKIIAANVQLTYNGTSWSLPAGSKLKFSPQYSYFVYYPYQTSLAGLPAINTTVSDISSSTQFFTDAIATWKSSKLAADQSTLEKMNACDLQIGKALLDDEDGCSVSFKMEHAMGLAVLNRESKSVTKHYILSGYTAYTWDNGTTTLIPSTTLSNSQKLYATTNTQGVKVIPPSVASTFSSTSTGNDAWTGDVNITAVANGVGTGTAKIKATKVDYTYTMEVGDIYYSDGALSHQEEKLISDKLPVGIVVYKTMNDNGNYWTEKNTKEKGIGGHALVMALKNAGTFDSGNDTRNNYGTDYEWSPSYTSNVTGYQTTNLQTHLNSQSSNCGSGFYLTNRLLSSSPAANAATNYQPSYNSHTNIPLTGNASLKTTSWFLPSCGQILAAVDATSGGVTNTNTIQWLKPCILSNGSTNASNMINKYLYKAAGASNMDEPSSNYTYFSYKTPHLFWVSSEYDPSTSVGLTFGYDGIGTIAFGIDYVLSQKTCKYPVRPFLAF